MTKTALATYAASKQGFSNAEFIAKAKEFAETRYELIWDEHLWRFSVADKSQTVAASPANGIVEIDDADMAFVLAIRLGPTEEIVQIDRETIFRIASEAYDNEGDTGGFDHLEPSATGKPRIKLFRSPAAELDLLTIGKKKTPAWADGDDPIALTGLTNTLLAFVAGDLLEYQRQYNKAQTKFAEGVALLQKMVDSEKNQMGRSIRIIPEPYEGGYTYDAHLAK